MPRDGVPKTGAVWLQDGEDRAAEMMVHYVNGRYVGWVQRLRLSGVGEIWQANWREERGWHFHLTGDLPMFSSPEAAVKAVMDGCVKPPPTHER